MKFLVSVFTSTRTMAVLLAVFALAMVAATFVENDFGTDAARNIVYNAKWFELILVAGLFNILGVTIKNKMYKKEKLTVLLFHFAFIVIIIGAGVTRYFSREGIMKIREGDTEDHWITSKSYIHIILSDNTETVSRSYPVLLSNLSTGSFRKKLNTHNERVEVKLKNYYSNAIKGIKYKRNGIPLIHLITTNQNGRQNSYLTLGDTLDLKNEVIIVTRFQDFLPDNNSSYLIIRPDGTLGIYSAENIVQVSMSDQQEKILPAFEQHQFNPATLYRIKGNPIVLKQFLPSGTFTAVPVDEEETNLPSALEFEIIVKDTVKSIMVFGSKENVGSTSDISFGDIIVKISYGAGVQKLPFSIHLNDFILKRYPGSESPSWFESNVQLIDKQRSVNSEQRIYMNHILKHRGYRFYQASYDIDEMGTVLSVNRDGAGTTITYLGYLLLALGMVLSLVNRKSHFRKLASGKANKSVLVILILLNFPLTETWCQDEIVMNKDLPVIEQTHASKFGQLLVQDNGGRIEPVNTLASEVLRKVSRKNDYKGQSPDQVLLGMMTYPELWQQEPMIKVSHDGIRNDLGIDSKYASFNDFFKNDEYGSYLLKPMVEEAYRKKPAYRTKYDNEIIRTDERVNICYLVYTAALLKMFPDPNDTTYKWHSPFTAPSVLSESDSIFAQHILRFYIEQIQQAVKTNEWETSDEMVGAIDLFQSRYGSKVLPSEKRIKAELLYNESDIFGRVTRVYLLVGLILLFIQFIHIFISKFNIRYYSVPAFAIIAIAFILHAFALGLRWYVSGHAPWSNGYEALTFIAWATVLAGLIFSKKSGITLSTSAVLAALILQTAHLSWMDPQVTNLVPVLKSYWLVIHVAIITASYGFLGLGALLATVNLLLMFFENKNNRARLEFQINQLSSIIEMALIIGLYMLTTGTFLGGVWANESWGRYWGWDPKETWALITVIAYAVVVHLRIIPGLKSRVVFNISSLVSFGFVLMTYFGVNYYLSGLHSYAKGDPVPVPPIVYYAVITVILLSALAAFNQFLLRKSFKNE
ncbi:MAG: cytochrome c biogenesis protein CcsA [Bacteroidales bacterium]|nr:cytochrome c biogenesis protein CcsA [Bacteroidales bacterium]